MCVDYSRISSDDLSSLLFYDIVTTSPRAIQLIKAIIKCKSTVNSDDISNTTTIAEQYNTTFQSYEFVMKIISDNLQIEKVAPLLLYRKQWRKAPLKPVVVGHKFVDELLGPNGPPMSCSKSNKETLSSIPTVYAYNSVKQTMEEIVVLEKMCQKFVVCSGYTVCAVGIGP